MLNNKRIGIVVPTYNEEKLIGKVIETMPRFVDKIIVVDDRSRDNTAETVNKLAAYDRRLLLVKHEKNMGVGAAISTGYKHALDLELDIVAVMAGDAQMDPEDLKRIVEPIVEERADYSKGNRLFTGEAWSIIPKHRYLGNAFLTLLTKIASGYWHIADSQSGYTAISAEVLKLLDLDSLYRRYGFPNDLLVKLNVYDCSVEDVYIRPVYNIGEKSKMRIWKVVPALSLLLVKDFFWRLFQKYVIRDFHPLIFFYAIGMLLSSMGFVLGLVILYRNTPLSSSPALPVGWIILCALFLITGLQSLFFAMWFDMEYHKYNKRFI
jgi:glycosyltransferase involved in cell wall biosynthesis